MKPKASRLIIAALIAGAVAVASYIGDIDCSWFTPPAFEKGLVIPL